MPKKAAATDKVPQQQQMPQVWKCPFCGLKIQDADSQSYRQRVIFHRKMHE